MAQPAHFLWPPTKGIKPFSRSFCSGGAREQPSNRHLAWFGTSPQPMGSEPSSESPAQHCLRKINRSSQELLEWDSFHKILRLFWKRPCVIFHPLAAQASRISFAAYLVNSICSILITVAVLILISCFRIRLSVICPRFLYRWFVS